MTWFKVDDGFWCNPKTMLVSDAAIALWLRAGTWASQQLTDGRIPRRALSLFSADAGVAAELVSAGLWIDSGDVYEFHDWHVYQPSAKVEKAKRAKRAEAGRKGAEARWGVGRDGKRDGKSHSKPRGNGSGKASSKPNAPSRPVPSSSSKEEEHASIDALFERAYEAWPKKAERKRSFEKFQQLAKKHDPEWLAGEIVRFGAAYAVATEKRFVPALVVWLNGERWTDELPTPEKAVLDQQWSQALSSVDPCAVEHKWTVDGTCARCVARKETA